MKKLSKCYVAVEISVKSVCACVRERTHRSHITYGLCSRCSLSQTINRLWMYYDDPLSNFFVVISEFERDELAALQEVLQMSDGSRTRSERLNSLDGEIRDAVFKLEDVIEIHISNHLLSHRSEDTPPLSISVDLKELKSDLDSFTEAVKKMKEAYIEELSAPPQKVDCYDTEVVPSRSGSGGRNSKMVGLPAHIYSAVKHDFTFTRDKSAVAIGLYGMAGIGKTTFAARIFEDPEIIDFFDSRAWVRVGLVYEKREILASILSQLNPDEILSEEGYEELAWDIEKSLRQRRCLIVLDDVWESFVCEDLKISLPYKDNGSRILVTSTMRQVADNPYSSILYTTIAYKLPFLNKEDSWRLLREKVFGDQQESLSTCSFGLEKAGKRIAEKCEGLPLLIVTVAGILSKADKTVEFWNEVAEAKQHSVFTDAYEHVSKFLLPSYNYLPQSPKACFLYMGIFPQGSDISRSNLVNLWIAEGFLVPDPYNSRAFELSASTCLKELVSRNVVILRDKVSALPRPRYCTNKYHLHSAFLYLCVREAGKNKYYDVLNRYHEDAEQRMEGQRRLCIQNNVLFAIKDLYDSMSSISGARSLLCTGPYHPYPVPICFGLRLLKVLDSATIRFYEFPIEVLELVHLRYLAMTYDGDLPGSISKLWSLEYLIVKRHISITSPGAPSYLPTEIWDMKELKHLQVTGSDLPDPCETSILPNLETLLDVSAHSCTQRIFRRIPNLVKLGIRTATSQPLISFDQISSCIRQLETLAITVDPSFGSKVVAPLPSNIYSRISNLSLSGVGYLWEDMRVIASSLSLSVLKLRCNACRGPEWETPPMGFQRLTYLLIEDCELVAWTCGEHSFKFLGRLSLKNCYQLKMIPERIGRHLIKIEVIDCNPSVVSWAKQRTEVEDVYVQSSWE